MLLNYALTMPLDACVYCLNNARPSPRSAAGNFLHPILCSSRHPLGCPSHLLCSEILLIWNAYALLYVSALERLGAVSQITAKRRNDWMYRGFALYTGSLVSVGSQSLFQCVRNAYGWTSSPETGLTARWKSDELIVSGCRVKEPIQNADSPSWKADGSDRRTPQHLPHFGTRGLSHN
jgi:hypothetical protein